MSVGQIFLFLGFLLMIVATVLQTIGAARPNRSWSQLLLIIGAFCSGISAATTWWGSETREEESKKELASKDSVNQYLRDSIQTAARYELADQYLSSENNRIALERETDEKLESVRKQNDFRLDKIRENSTNDLKEAFGVMSKRTMKQFLAEKTPPRISFDETTLLIKKAINKWICDSVFSNSNTPLMFDPKLRMNGYDSTEGGWVAGCCTKLKVNWQIKRSNQRMYWDAYLYVDDAPNDHTYIHVIVDAGGKEASNTYLTNEMKASTRNLYYKYCRWYDSIPN